MKPIEFYASFDNNHDKNLHYSVILKIANIGSVFSFVFEKWQDRNVYLSLLFKNMESKNNLSLLAVR